MDTQTHPDRAKSTLIQYEQQGRSFIKRYQKFTGESWRSNPTQFMRWFIALREGWKPASWRFNRQAVAHVMRNESAPIEVLEMLNDETLLAQHPFNMSKPKELRRKRILAKDELAYLEKLARSPAEMAELAALFLKVNPEIGLRPKEWADARIKGNRLIVRNAKNSHGRSTGDTRELILHESLRRDLVCAFEVRDKFIAKYGLWAEVQEKLKYFLRDFSRRHGLPNITMYVTRHQFSANIKSAGYSKREVADAMGHASEDTAGEHYGRRSSGRGFVMVAPVNNNAATQTQTPSPTGAPQ